MARIVLENPFLDIIEEMEKVAGTTAKLPVNNYNKYTPIINNTRVALVGGT